MCNCRNVTVLKGDKGDTGATGPQGPAGTMGYDVFTCYLEQNLTSNPTATILANTLGGTPSITRSNTGDYVLTLAGAFPDVNKIHSTAYTFGYSRGAAFPVFNDASGLLIGYVKIYWIDADSLGIYVYHSSASKMDLSTLVGNNIKLVLPEIRVYP